MGGDTAPSTIPRSPCLHKTCSARQAQIRSRHILPKIQSITKLSQNRRYLEHPLRSQYPATEGNTSYHTTPDWRVHANTTCLLHVPHQPNPSRIQIRTATSNVHTHHNIRAYTREPHTSHPTIGNRQNQHKRFSRR